MMKCRTLLAAGTNAFAAPHVARSKGAKALTFRLKHVLPLCQDVLGRVAAIAWAMMPKRLTNIVPC